MIESGRARYTYSNEHGMSTRVLRALAREHLAVAGDEDRLAGRDIPHDLVAAATRARATRCDDPLVADEPGRARPSTSGRMPNGSRNASSPCPAISAIAAYEPSTRSCSALIASNTWSGSRSLPRTCACSSLASTLTSSSVSESVLRCRRSMWKSSSVSSRVFVRLPLCTSTMPYGAFT